MQIFDLKNSDKFMVTHNNGSTEKFRETDIESLCIELECDNVESIKSIFAI